jgi:hypothetical protein
MKNSIFSLFVAVISLVACSSSRAAAPNSQAYNWEKLGSKKVNFRLDRDVIQVGAKDGRFSKLKIEVTGGSLNMKKMVVEYRNGDKENIQLKNSFGKKSGSRVIDLKGNKRIIKDITFVYDSVNRPGHKATIHVFGKH